MAKSAAKKSVIKKILIGQPKPDSDKSPYHELSRKYQVEFVFEPFIILDGISAKEFRKQKIDIAGFTAVIFTSRNAIDHFFRMCEEMKVSVSQETKYFCINESVALYLQKFILYRKRKVFYGADANNKSMLDVIQRHKDGERFLYVCSENQQDNEICSSLKQFNADYQLAFMYRSISNDVTRVINENKFDVICFFTPSSVKSLLDSFPDFEQNGTYFAAFGSNTGKAIQDAGFQLHIEAPTPVAKSLPMALDNYLGKSK